MRKAGPRASGAGKPRMTTAESSRQLVRKLSGSCSALQGIRPRRRQVATAARELLDSLVTNAPPRYREVEAAKARVRADRFRSSETRRAT